MADSADADGADDWGIDVDTPLGPGRVTLRMPSAHLWTSVGTPVGLLVIGHGAGGWSWSKDVLSVRDAVSARGWAVALVDQPWRLAGRKVADLPPRLDEAWPFLVAAARERVPQGVLVVGGRSAGARVACRTHAMVGESGADGVLCLSFPLHLPGKASRPGASRVTELALPLTARVPVQVLQGVRDPFGTPEEIRGAVAGQGLAGDRLDLVEVPGTHTLTSPVRVADAASAWLFDLT